MTSTVTPRSGRPPNITIDTDLQKVPGIAFAEVPQRMAELSLSELQLRQAKRVVEALQRALEDHASNEQLGALLDELRMMAPAAYESIGKPLFIDYLRRRQEPAT